MMTNFLIVSRIPLSLRSRGIEIDVAKKEHEAYVQLLRELELDVIEMPSDEELPESVFVEDTAVVCNNIALITKPGNPNRLKEVRKEVDRLRVNRVSRCINSHECFPLAIARCVT